MANVYPYHICTIAQWIDIRIVYDHIPIEFKRIEIGCIRPKIDVFYLHAPDKANILVALIQRVHRLVIQTALAHDHPLQIGETGKD